MIARFWYDGIALEALQLAQIGCLPDSDMIIETTIDAGRTWQQHRLEEWINDHPEVFDASRRVNRRRAGRWMEWIFTINPPRPEPVRKEPETMDIAKLYPDKYLKAEHLNGKSIRATISKVTIEELRNPRKEEEKTRKAVLHFARSQKILPLNKTQAYDLASITGSTDTDAWPGFVVVLSPGRARNNMATIVISAPPQEKPPQPEPAASAGSASDSDAEFDALPRAMDDPEHVAKIK